MNGFNAVATPTLVNTVANALRSEIMSGVLAPGERIRQDAVSEQLGVSRTPLREAFRLLISEGWLEEKPRVGVRVSPLTVGEVQEVATMRLLLEPFASRVAAMHQDDADLRRAVKLLGSADQLSAEFSDVDAAERIEELNREFHYTIYGFETGLLSDSFVLMSEQYWLRFRRYRRYYLSQQSNRQRSVGAHESIFAAWRERDGEAAGREMAQHILHAVEEIIYQLDESVEPSVELCSAAEKYGLTVRRHAP